MNTDQQKSIDALSLFYGGWAKIMDVSEDYPSKLRPVVSCHTAGDQPNWIVFEDGSAIGGCEAPYDNIIKMTPEQIHTAVYDENVWDGPSSHLEDFLQKMLDGRDPGK